MTAPLLALALTLSACLLLAQAFPDSSPPASIPLKAAAIATPVRFPTVPPIRGAALFVSTQATPFFFPDWHRKTLMSWYMPEREPEMGMH